MTSLVWREIVRVKDFVTMILDLKLTNKAGFITRRDGIFVNSPSNNMNWVRTEEGWSLLSVIVEWYLDTDLWVVKLMSPLVCKELFRPILTLMDTNIMISYDDVKFTVDVSKEAQQRKYKANKLSWRKVILMAQTRSVNLKVFSSIFGI